MATTKEYGYYIEGNKIALVEKKTSFDNDANSREYGPGTDALQWKSPIESIDKGLEIVYSYAPTYNIQTQSGTNIGGSTAEGGVFWIFGWTIVDGYLSFVLGGQQNAQFVDFSSTDYDEELGEEDQALVIQGSNRWNGMHRLKSKGVGYIQTKTRVYGYPYFQIHALFDFLSGVNLIDNDSVFDDQLLRAFADEVNADEKAYFMFKKGVNTVHNQNQRIYEGTPTDNVDTVTSAGDPGTDYLKAENYYQVNTQTTLVSDPWKATAVDSSNIESLLNTNIQLLKIVKDSSSILYAKNSAEIMDNEEFNVDMPDYLSKAAVDYVKAKYLEDNGQFKESQYFMNKFKKQVEKYNNGLVTGARMISSGPNGIR